MKPKPKEKHDYERVPEDDFVRGVLVEIEYDEDHEREWKGEKTTFSAVRFKFELNGCKFPHYSRWMTFSYGEKTNLFSKYLSALIEGAVPDFDFDLDALRGMKVKTLWSTKNDYQGIETIRPDGPKIPRDTTSSSGNAEEDIPF